VLDPLGRARTTERGGSEKNGLWLTKKNADAQHLEKTAMQEIVQLLVMLVAYYATFGIMAVGFGMMLNGSDGARSAGNFFLVRPLRAVLQWARAALLAAVTATWSNIIGVVGRWLATELREVARDIRWLVTRERGWLRRR
jgi:hypothetical protein